MKNVVANFKNLEGLIPFDCQKEISTPVPILGEAEIINLDFSFLDPIQFSIKKEETQTDQEFVSFLNRASLTDLQYNKLENSVYENNINNKNFILTPFLYTSQQSLTSDLHIIYLTETNQFSGAPLPALSSINVNYPVLTNKDYFFQIQIAQIIDNITIPLSEEFNLPRIFRYYLTNKQGNLFFSYFRSDFPVDTEKVFLNPLELNQVWLKGILQQWLFELIYLSPRGAVIGKWKTIDDRYLKLDLTNKRVYLISEKEQGSLFYLPGWSMAELMDFTHQALHKKGNFIHKDHIVRYDSTKYTTSFLNTTSDYYTLFTIASSTKIDPYVYTQLSFPLNKKTYSSWRYYVNTDPQVKISYYDEQLRTFIQQISAQSYTFSDNFSFETKEPLPLSTLQIENQVWASPVPDLSPIITTVLHQPTGDTLTQTIFLSSSPSQTWPLSTLLNNQSLPSYSGKWVEFRLQPELSSLNFTTHYLRNFTKYLIVSTSANPLIDPFTTVNIQLPDKERYIQYFENKQKSITHLVHKLEPLEQKKERQKNDIGILQFHQMGELQSDVTIHLTFDIQNWDQIPITNLVTNMEKEPVDGSKPGGFSLQTSTKNKASLCCFVDNNNKIAKIRFLEKFQLLKQISLPKDITIIQHYIDESKIWLTGPKKTNPQEWKIYGIKFDGSIQIEKTFSNILDITNITKHQDFLYFHFVIESSLNIKTRQIKIHSLTGADSEDIFNGKKWIVFDINGVSQLFDVPIFFVQGADRWETIGKNLYKNGKFFYYTGRIRALSIDPFGYIWYLDEFGKLVKLDSKNPRMDPIIKNAITTNFENQQTYLCKPFKDQHLPFAKIQFIYHSELKTFIGVLIIREPDQIIQFDLQTGMPFYSTIYQSTDIYNTVEPLMIQEPDKLGIRWRFLIGPKQGNTTIITDYSYLESQFFPRLSPGVHCFTVVIKNHQIRLFIDGWLFDILNIPTNKICYGLTSRQLLIGTEVINSLPIHRVFLLPEQKLFDSDGCLEAEVWCGSFFDWEVLARARLSLQNYQSRPLNYPVTIHIPLLNQTQNFKSKEISHLYFHHLPGQQMQKLRISLNKQFQEIPEISEEITQYVKKVLPVGFDLELVSQNFNN